MQKTTDFFGISAICLEDGSIVGEVKNVYFDEGAKQAIYLGIFKNTLLLLPFDKVVATKDAIMLASCADLLDCRDVDMTNLCTLDGKDIYSVDGVKKGSVQAVELYKGGKTNKILTEDGAFNPSAFATFGDVLIQKIAKKRTVQRKIPRDKTNRKVEVFDLDVQNSIPLEDVKEAALQSDAADANTQNAEDSSQISALMAAYDSKRNLSAVQEVVPKKLVQIEQGSPLFTQDAIEKIVGGAVAYQDIEDERTPARVITDYDFLLGRTLLRDLSTYAGTLLAKSGTIVTKDLVETASRHGKLVELTLNSSYK